MTKLDIFLSGMVFGFGLCMFILLMVGVFG